MAAFQLHNRPPPSAAVPCRLSTVVLLLLCLLLSCSHPISCTCSGGSHQDPLESSTVSGAFDQLPGYLFRTNMSSSRTNWERVDCRGLGSYIKTNYPDLSQKGWFLVRQEVIGSFSVVFSFSMSIYQPNNQMKQATKGASLVFAVLPSLIPSQSSGIFTPPNWQVLGPSSSSNPSSSTDSAGSHLTAEIGTAGEIIWVQIGIDSAPVNSSSVAEPAARKSYTVWIDYDYFSQRMSVYIDDAGEDAPQPANAKASKNITTASPALLGLFSSMGQLLQVHTWNSTVHWLPAFGSMSTGSQMITGNSPIPFIVSGVFALVVMTIVAAGLFLYCNSKHRRWQKEQDELTKIMQGMPGVPGHLSFTKIKKATNNFHETTKLGQGGFGAVYRCKPPPAEASTAMDLAVKKFTREVEDLRSSDFIVEVSIISRLRHKNIVPLIGWSYSKGETLLAYEYMTNGSLDQHLFQRGSAQQQDDSDKSLRQWQTRYGIAGDIATGLHYIHHEHDPMVLHRDIKASNVMLDSDFHARLGDFGIACTVAVNRSSVTGVAGTWGYIGPDYAMSRQATHQTDIYAFGVLILEIVTGKKAGDMLPEPDDENITDWIWRLHGEGKLLDAVDASLLAVVADEARRLLLLGLACTNPNPPDRPSMAQVLLVITKVMPPPDVPPQKPAFVWPPRDWRSRNSMYSTAMSDWDQDGGLEMELSQSQVSMEQPSVEDTSP